MTNWQVSWWGLVAVWATTFGLSNLLVLGPWLVMPLGLTATMMAAVLLVDRLPGGRRGRLSLAGLAAVVVWAGWLLVCCGHRTAGSGQSLATPWERVVSNVAASWEALPKYHRPVRQVDLFLPLVLLAIGAITLLVAVLLARAPSWSGLPLLIGWLCLLTADPSGAPLPLLIAVMAYLLVLGARRRSSLGLFGGHTTAVGMVIALALALALVLGLAGPRLPGWGRLASESSIWDGGLSRSVQSGLAVDAPVSLDLVHANSDGPTLFRVSDLTIDRWRLTSSTRFDGRTWRFDQDGQTDPLSLAPDWGANLSDSNDDQRWWRETDAQVELVNLNKDVLPLPVGPTAVIATSSVIEANYNPGIDALTVTDGQSGLESYKLLTDVLDRAALTGGSAQLSHGEQSWTSLDDLPHERDIRQLAKDLTIGSTSDLQRLQAIVDYLRGAQFTYDLTPPEQSTDDPVWSFLSSKRGYCIHFATAMVVLATAIGLPARVAIGYAHGHAQSDGWMSFNAATAHMWPEIYFDRLGWVPFEPTPGSSEDQPDHNASSAAPSATASTSAAPSATASSAANSHPSPAANQSTTPNATLISRSSSSILLVMALIVLAAITAGALIWRWRRVDRFTPEQAWRQIERLGQRREHFPAGLTVAQVVERFQTRLPADNALTDPLVQLADEIQRRRYQPPSASLGLREADPSNSRRWWRLVRHLSQIVRRN